MLHVTLVIKFELERSSHVFRETKVELSCLLGKDARQGIMPKPTLQSVKSVDDASLFYVDLMLLP